MGLLDSYGALVKYYKQFQGLSDSVVNRGLRERAAERRALELDRVPVLDLSRTTWHELPHPDIVNAITFAARRALNTYADPAANPLRAELARRHDVAPTRVVVGNGVAQLLQDAARELLEPGDELVTPWPSYPLYPLMARRAGGAAVPVPNGEADALLRAVTERTRVVCVCRPNDPTGALLDGAGLRRLLDGLPERAVVLADEALVDFAEAGERDAALALLGEHPRLLVFRTFSKAWGLAGLRCGYAVGGPGAEPLLEHLAPDGGIDELAQAGALEALRSAAGRVAVRAAGVAAERTRLAGELAQRGLAPATSQANVLWMAAPGGDGAALAQRIARGGVTVATGAVLGEPAHLRVTVRDQPASERFLRALDAALG